MPQQSQEWDSFIAFVYDKFGFLKTEKPTAVIVDGRELLLRPGQLFGLTLVGFRQVWEQTEDKRTINYEGLPPGYIGVGRLRNAKGMSDRGLVMLVEKLADIDSTRHPVLSGWLHKEIEVLRDELILRLARRLFSPRSGVQADHTNNARLYIDIATEIQKPVPSLNELSKGSGLSKSSWDRLRKDVVFLSVLFDTAKTRKFSKKYTRNKKRDEFMGYLLVGIQDMIDDAPESAARTTRKGGASPYTDNICADEEFSSVFDWLVQDTTVNSKTSVGRKVRR